MNRVCESPARKFSGRAEGERKAAVGKGFTRRDRESGMPGEMMGG